MREFFIVTHRWVALVISVFLVVISLAGAAVAYEPEIDRVTNPGLWRASAPGAALPLDTLLARVEGADRVWPAQVPGRATVFEVRRREVFVDPASGRVLGQRTLAERNAGVARRLHALHTNILVGPVGHLVVYWTSMGAIYLVVTGIILWWPDKIWRIRMSVSWKRINFDFHHALGIVSSLVLLVLAVTGVLLSSRPVNQLAYRVAGQSPRPRPSQPAGEPGAARITLGAALAAAQARLPGASVISIDFPERSDRPIEVAMRFPEDRTPEGLSVVVLDRYRATVLGALSSREMRPGTRFVEAQWSLHTGAMGGTPLIILWIGGSLAMAVQAVTGFIMWLNARKGRKALLLS